MGVKRGLLFWEKEYITGFWKQNAQENIQMDKVISSEYYVTRNFIIYAGHLKL
jgi:hypothetical protein